MTVTISQSEHCHRFYKKILQMFPFLPNRLVFGGKVDRLEGKIVATTGQTKSPIPLQFPNGTSSHLLTELSDELENEKIEATFEIRSPEHS